MGTTMPWELGVGDGAGIVIGRLKAPAGLWLQNQGAQIPSKV